LQHLRPGLRPRFGFARSPRPPGARAGTRHAGEQFSQLPCRLCRVRSGGAACHRAGADADSVHRAAREGSDMTSASNPAAYDETVGDPRHRLKVLLTNIAIDAFLIAFSLAMLLPLVFLVGNAFKTPQELLLWPPTVVPQ